MSQFISLADAITMTSRYRTNKETILASTYQGQNILCRCESFERAYIDEILSKEDCEGLRIYYGMDESLKVHAILVGYDSEDADILPAISVSLSDPEDTIVENGKRCPEDCPPLSDLNP